MNKELTIDPAINTSMFSRTGSIRHNRLYSDRHGSERRRVSQTPKSVDVKMSKPTPSAPVYQPQMAPPAGHYSPFNTVSRDARNSYLLRVTCEQNVKTIYRPNFDFGRTAPPGFSFQKQKIVRKISNISYDQNLGEQKEGVIAGQCEIRLGKGITIDTPLVIQDTHKHRKNHHELDFNKQTSYQKPPQRGVISGQSSPKPKSFSTPFSSSSSFSPPHSSHPNRTHDFSSYTPHQYLLTKGDKKVDIFAANDVNWGRVRKNWDTRGLTPFKTYTDRIKVRQDRSEPEWGLKLDYEPDVSKIKPRLTREVVFEQYTERRGNEEGSRYPMRLSQRKEYGMRRFEELKERARGK